MTILAAFIAITVLLGACAVPGTADLRGTSWELASLSGNGLIPGTAITLAFSEDALSGSAGCNNYGGSYQVSGSSLTFSDLFATEMACPEPPGVLEQETAFLAALNEADSYQLAGERLEIFDESGRQLLVFVTSTGAATTQLEQALENPDAAVLVVNQNPAARVSNPRIPNVT